MPLTTRCGRCGRLFPIYAQQLRSFRGRVRCPQCGHRFNGRKTLIDEPMLDRGTPDGRARLGFASQPQSHAGSGPWTPPGRAPRRSMQASEPVPVTLPAPGPGRRTSPLGRLIGGLVALILTSALAAQVLWWKRADLLQDPDNRRVARSICERLHCTPPMVRIQGAMEAMEPSLTEDPDGGAMILALKIRNTADLPQAAPLLDLELVDHQGERAAARRFTPEEYGLGDESRLLAPGETVAVSLSLAARRTETSGFKVRLP